MTSREQQSTKVNMYMLENFIPGTPSCNYNCRSLNDKTHVDVETVLIRGRISEPVDNTPFTTEKPADHNNKPPPMVSFEPEFGEQTRMSKACYFEQTLDRFDPVMFQNNTYDNQTLFGMSSRLTKYNM
jgi:hypothetical protein